MSASPSQATPNGGQPTAAPVMRKKPAAASMFHPKKKKPLRKPLPAQAHTANGLVPVSGQFSRGPAVQPIANHSRPAAPVEDDPSTYVDYPIYVQKSALLMPDSAHHAFRLQVQQKQANGRPVVMTPFDETQFQRPVRLFRKLAQEKQERGDLPDAPMGVDDKEREAREIQKAERQAQREANQALIAPSGETAGKKPTKKKPQKKVEDVYMDDANPEKKKRSQLRYEEARPWHLEDFEGKNKWVGSYEEPMSYTNVLFTLVGDGFTMVPVEKWYKMIRQDRVQTYDGEQIEKIMQSNFKAPRWIMKEEKKPKFDADGALIKPKTVKKRRNSDDEEGMPAVKTEEYRADVDEIDFEFGGEFQDDDEGFLFGDQDEADSKELERRLQQEMRQANLPDSGVKDEGIDWEKQEVEEKENAEAERKKQKKLRRKLKRKEFRHEYESDDEDGNQYAETSESEDSEEEREREEEERKKEEAKKAELANGGKSGASSKGSNTPTGRAEKKGGLGSDSLKRGAADASDLSGNESTRRKKAKIGSGQNGSRLAPDAAKRLLSGYASGSDTDTSRVGRPSSSTSSSSSKLKLKHSPPGSPSSPPSRAGTPKPSAPGSRAQSPARTPQPLAFPTLEEITLAIPKEGIAIGDLVKGFKSRVGPRTGEFIKLVKAAGRQDNVSKKIVPKD